MPAEMEPLQIYTISYRPFDGDTAKGNLLSSALRDYFHGKTVVKGSFNGVENGRGIHASWRIANKRFLWKKKCGRAVLQEAFSLQDGRFCLVTHHVTGQLLSTAFYGPELDWRRTAYYSGGSAKPAAILTAEKGGVALYRYLGEQEGYTQSLLVACRMKPGTAEQSCTDSAAGVPQVCASTDRGEYCFCAPAERDLRMSLMQKSDSADIRWPKRSASEIRFGFVRNEEEKQPEPAAPVPEEGYAADHELYQIAAADPASLPETVSMPHPVPLPNPVPAPLPVPLPNPVPPPRPEPASAGQAPEPQPALAKYAVAACGLSGAVVRSNRLESKKNPDPQPKIEPQQEARANEPVEGQLIPAKRIVVSSMESYLYFGKLLKGLREGQGRTQMQNGHTAYEGSYHTDKRDGFGVYYYKSGKLSYAGGWKQNLRDGMGVAFGSKDGSIFVGNWENGIPTGQGSEFDLNGNLIFNGEWKNGKRHGRGTEYRDGRMVSVGSWEEGRFRSGYRYVEEKKESGV